ncbi:GtrA family protein [Gluconacetobacter johannae DSM 13595]|uniref:GtrA family protein n=1 Tax=Gluconacetobacter johannae TaxID=112140 RepID=A0A7W4J6Z0_9PROT|nr:GtrA family protein [Gluconacetobacter johannae]MBB2175878.1 GtrA family protein [Gluconacetobacter johannae]GBQ81440.1 GtrA family protein [Gluconacetobacter johannae DSM 13595]
MNNGHARSDLYLRLGELARFLFVGAGNTLFGLLLIFMLISYAGADYRVANFLGYMAGYVISFSLNRLWTFRHAGCWKKGFLRWSLVALIAYLVNLSVVVFTHTEMGIGIYTAQITGIAVYTMTSFLGGRFFAFAMEPSV